MNNKISIIIPVYNVENYIERCIDSLISQSYINLEIILVDDGSTDKSGEICDRYAVVDNRIKVIHIKNSGRGEARNIGLSQANGQYIGFVDSDDWVEKDLYKYMIENIEETKADISICAYYECLDDIKNKKMLYEKSFVCTGKEALHYTMSNVIGVYWLNIAIWNKLYKKAVVENIRFRGREYEDIMYNAEVIYSARNVSYINKCLYNYRLSRTGSIITEGFQRKTIEFEMKYKEERVEFFKRNNEIKLARDAEAVVIHDKLLYYAFMSLSKDNYSEYIRKYKEDLRKSGFIADAKTNIALLIFKCFPRLWIKIIKKKYKY
jgi:glycosyltransferase, group 2 family